MVPLYHSKLPWLQCTRVSRQNSLALWCLALPVLLRQNCLRATSLQCGPGLTLHIFGLHSALDVVVCMLTLMDYSGVCYNERCYNVRMLQRTIFINKIRMLQRTRRNTIGRRSTHVRMTFRAFALWIERQSSAVLSFVRFSSVQFSSVVGLVQLSACCAAYKS
jgi:hypothetical protein